MRVSKLTGWVAEARKFLITVAGAVATALAYGELHGNVAKYASAFLAVLTALGVYSTANRPRQV